MRPPSAAVQGPPPSNETRAQPVALLPPEMPPLDQPQTRPEPQPAPPKAVPLGPDSDRPDAPVPQEAGPDRPEPEIDPPVETPPEEAPAPSAPAEPTAAPTAVRIPTPRDFAAAMRRIGQPTSPFGPPAADSAGSAAPRQPAAATSAVGAMGRVGVGRAPDTRDWRPSFPTAAGRCVEIPDLGRNADGTPVLAAVIGRVYEQDGRTPLTGAHLQIVGTPYVTFSDATGEYRLEFDPKLLERCRVQYVRVSADGYDGRMLTLSIGRDIRSDDVHLRRK